ncbi:MAG: hypothetical protein D3915_05945 [Candidatus Electrothrix sp. AU1_5]|nr:hypothetical protein [Candidatus Electrothrix gigas]
MNTPLRERILREREIEYERIQSELEHARVQSEIRRNDAEAKKMEAEKEKLNESLLSKRNIIKYIFSVIKYSIAGVILSCVLFAFALDTGKNLYDITSRENEKLQNERIELQKRIRATEKRYVEALIRQASANAYMGFLVLKKREAYLNLPQATQKRAQAMLSEASQIIYDYWYFIVRMTEEIQVELFPEAKQEVADWLQQGAEKNFFSEECRTENSPHVLSPIQRKSLDLIERHVNQVRAGNSQFPNDLIDTFIEQLESQESDNGENK